MEFCPLQRIKLSRAVRVAMHRTIPLRRCRAFLAAWIPRSNGNRDSSLRSFAGGSCIASFLGGDVPLSANHAQPCRGLSPGHRSWGLPFAVFYSCPPATECFHCAGPTCRFLSVRPGLRFLCRGPTACAVIAPTENQPQGRATVDPGRSPRLLGFTRGQSAPHGFFVNAAPGDTALGFRALSGLSNTHF
jgi:hypothetical protein